MCRFVGLAMATLLLLSLVGCLSTVENSLVFQPDRAPDGLWRDGRKSPMKDAEILTDDGVKLHGWYLEAAEPRAVVLYLHGNGGNVTNCAAAMKGFHQAGATVLAFDYRGYGLSEGTPSETGVLADARAARRWLAKQAGVQEKDIVLAGFSLGGGIAVDLAAKEGARGLILENTFTSLPDVAESHYPLLPVHWVMSTRLDSEAKIARYHGPLLQTHGDADDVVPFDLGKRLFQAANEPKTFVAIRGGDHNNLWAGSPTTASYREALKQFLETLP